MTDQKTVGPKVMVRGGGGEDQMTEVTGAGGYSLLRSGYWPDATTTLALKPSTMV